MNGEDQAQPKPVNEGLLGGTRPIKMSQTHVSSNRIWMILAIAFMAISIALAAYVIYVEVSDSSSSSSADKEKDLVARYPGFFRTPAEQVIYAKNYQTEFERNVTRVPVEEQTEEQPPEYCSYQCARPQRKKRSSATSTMMQWLTMYKAVHRMERAAETPLGSPVYHACCISRHKFISPDTAKDRNNQDVTIVQFQDRNQYFSSWECRHAQDCTGCRCLQERHLITAVILNRNFPDESDDEFVVDFIVINGCCKCYNTTP